MLRPALRHLRPLLAAAQILLAFLPVSGGANTGSYLPPGTFSYQETRLPNGLRIVSQQVRSAPYVSARLVIRTGTDDFPCADQELPHLVEHLLFSANSQLTESDIDDRVTDWGGVINAYTYPEQTDVVLDVHARFQADAMHLLAAMIRDFAPEAADVAREKVVVERESGVVQSPLRLWWSQQDFSALAAQKLGVAAGFSCASGITPVRPLTVTQVRNAFATYYVPANMVLILVGDLSNAGLAAAVAEFSALPTRPVPARTRPVVAMPTHEDFVSGWLSGTAQLDVPTAYGVSAFHDWEGYHAMLLVETWLNDRMFRELRSERGIAYTPSASVRYYRHPLLLTQFVVETSPDDTGLVMAYLRELTNEVRAQGIPQEDFERLRQSALLAMAQSFERISDRADYLATSIPEIDDGRLFNIEAFYQQLDYPRFRALVARDWPDHFIVINNAPRLSWNMVTGLLAGSVLLLMIGLALFVWRRLRSPATVV